MAAAARRQVVAVRGIDDDGFEIDAELFRDELHERGVVALAHRLRADAHDHLVVARHLDLGAFGRVAGGGLDILADGDAGELAALLCLRAPRLVSGPVGHLRRQRHVLLELATVIGRAHRVGEGQLVGADQVAAAQFDRVDAQFDRGDVDQPLHDVDRLRPPGAAIGADRRGVSHDAANIDIGGRHGIDVGQDLRADLRRDGDAGRAAIGADIGDRVDAHGEEPAVAVKRQFAVRDMVAAVQVAEEGLAAVADPLDGAAQPLRRGHHQHLFGVGVRLHAEAAADIVDEHADLRRRAFEEGVGEPVAQQMPVLVRGIDGVAAAVGIIAADGAARLHRILDDALVDQPHPRDMRRAFEGCIGLLAVADLRPEQEILRHVGPELDDAVIHGARRVDGEGQWRIVHRDRLGGVARLLACFRDDEGDRIADIAHPVVCQRVLRRIDQRRAVGLGQRGKEGRRAGKGADAVIRQILAGQHRQHAGHRCGAARIDRPDVRMGVRRAQHMADRGAGCGIVVVELALAGEQPRILDPPHRLADTVLRHDRCLPDIVLLLRRSWNGSGGGGNAQRDGLARMPGSGRGVTDEAWFCGSQSR